MAKTCDRYVCNALKQPYWFSAKSALLLALLSACRGEIKQTANPTILPITHTTLSPTATFTTEVKPTPTDSYHFDSGGPITPEMLKQMQSEDPTVSTQITWLNEWGDWYRSADPSVRPMWASGARQGIVFFRWMGADNSVHYRAAWKFPDYEGYILAPPAADWDHYNLPVAASEGHDIAPGQRPVEISTEVTDGNDLALTMGLPVGTLLTAEQGSGAWVMVFNDQVLARVDNETALWHLVYKTGLVTSVDDFTPMPTDVFRRAVHNDEVSTPKLDINAKSAMRVGEIHNEGGYQVFTIGGDIGVNLLPRAAISKVIPGVGVLREIDWEGIVNVNGHNERIWFAITEEFNDGNEQGESDQYKLLAGSKHLVFRLFISEKPINPQTINPVVLDALAHADANAAAAKKFQQGGNVLDTVFYTCVIFYEK